MKVPFGCSVWGGFTLLASLSVHGFLLGLPISLDLTQPEPEPEPIAAVPLKTFPDIASPPPEPLVFDREISPQSEVISAAEVYEPAASPPAEVIRAVEVYEPEVSQQAQVEIESEWFDGTRSVSRDRNQQLPVQPAVELEKLRQQKIHSMKEQAAQSNESPIPDPNLDNTSPNPESEMFAQMDLGLNSYLTTFNEEDRSLVDTNDTIVKFLQDISLFSPNNMLNNLLLDESGNFKEGILPEKLRLISFHEDEEMTAKDIYQKAIEPTINSEEYKSQPLRDVQNDINEDRIYLVEQQPTQKSPEDRSFYIQLIMVRSPIPNQKIAAIIVWDRQPEPLFLD